MGWSALTRPLNWTWLTRLEADVVSRMPLPSTPLQSAARHCHVRCVRVLHVQPLQY